MTDRVREIWLEKEEKWLSERLRKAGLNYSINRSINNPTGRSRRHDIVAVQDGQTGERSMLGGYHQDTWNTYLTLKFCNEILEMIERKEWFNEK